MGADQAWQAEPDDLDEPEEELEYWEEDDLTPEELTRWFGMVRRAERVRAAERRRTPEDGPGVRDGRLAAECSEPALWPQAEGSVPDLIAAVLAAAGEPALMTDAELVTSLAGWHAVASRAAGRELRATEELLRRRKPRVWDRRADRAQTRRAEPADAIPGQPGAGEAPERVMPAVLPSREAAAEIAMALTATDYSAQAQAELAADLSRRLPRAFGELDAGRADLPRVRLLAEVTQFLSDEDAGEVDALLARLSGTMTTGELRAKARNAVIKIDRAAAERRRKRAERKARFAVYGNDDQTATAAVEQMPAHLGAAAKARVNAIARAAKAAGMTDPMPLLEAKVATGLLLGTLPEIPPPADGGPGDPGGAGPSGGPPGPGPAEDPWDGGWPADWFAGPQDPAGGGDSGPVPTGPSPAPAPGARGPADPGPADPAPADLEARVAGPEDASGDDVGTALPWPLIPAQAAATAPGCAGLPAWLRPRDPGRTRLTVAWRTLAGVGPEPGDLSWIGPVTPGAACELAAAAAADPECTWRLIVTDDEGHAIAITSLRTRRGTGTGPPGLVSEVTVTIPQSLAAALGDYGQASDRVARTVDRANFAELTDLLAKAVPAANIAAAEAAVRAAADVAAGGCAHSMEVPGYRVTDRLRRWLNTRDRTCRNPVCRQPAARCDQDHTLAYHRGGRTCSCNLGGLCRFHHELKQLPGWQLSQDAGGCFTWRTPSGLTYRKEPYSYPV